jgi:hypothetical protein
VATIQEFKLTQALKTISFEISPPLPHIKNAHKIYKGKINYKKGPIEVQK